MSSRLDELIDSAFKDLAGKSLEEPIDSELCQVDLKKIQQTLLQIRNEAQKERDHKLAEIRDLTKELEDVKHSYVTLQADYESKFEKNKLVSLVIPQAKAGLEIKEDDHDSIKSFRPDSDDDSDDVKRKEEELKAKKLQQQIMSGHHHHQHKHVAGRKCCHNHSHNHLYMDTHQQHYGL